MASALILFPNVQKDEYLELQSAFLSQHDIVLLEKVAEGGFGEVYKAQNAAGFLRCIKMSKKEDEEEIKKIKKREELADIFRHTNILRFHTSGEIEKEGKKRYYVEEEWVEGPTLETVLKRESFSPPDAARIMQELVSGIAHIHRQGYVHNDIKVNNIMFDELLENRVVLVDFSNAERVDQAGYVLDPSAELPSHRIRAPELDKGGKISTRSDVWALGIVLSQILTGKNPKEEDIKGEEFVRTYIPRQYRSVIQTCLQANPESRYKNAENLLKALKKAEWYYTYKIGVPLSLSVAGVFLCSFALGADSVRSRIGDWYLNRCMDELWHREAEVAEKYCQKSRKWSPENPYVYFYLGQSLLEQGKYPEAKASYFKAHAAGEEYPGQDFRNNPHVPTLLEEQAVLNQKNGNGENADIMITIAEELKKQKNLMNPKK